MDSETPILRGQYVISSWIGDGTAGSVDALSDHILFIGGNREY
jgi:hypothetical protein